MIPVFLAITACTWITDAEWQARTADLLDSGPSLDTGQGQDTGPPNDSHEPRETGDSGPSLDTEDSAPPFDPRTYLGEVELTNEAIRFFPDERASYLGHGPQATAFAGDIDADGITDLAMGAYGADDGNGTVYLFYSPITEKPGDYLNVSEADAILLGEGGCDWVGWALSGAGDENGDGFDDLLIGADGWDPAHSCPKSQTGYGKIYLLHGPITAGTMQLLNSEVSFLGPRSDADAGCAMTDLGDVGGDELDDFAIAARYAHSSTDVADVGQVYVYLGPVSDGEHELLDADVTISGALPASYLGSSVAGPGDVNGDGWNDLLIGSEGSDAPGFWAGEAYVYHGPLSAGAYLSTDADFTMQGEQERDRAGYFVSAAGDVNGDGYADLLVGAPYSDDRGTDAGIAYLVLGSLKTDGIMNLSEADSRFRSENADSMLGNTTSPAGDIDQDGFDDIVLGATGFSDEFNYMGRAYLYYGPVSSGNVEVMAADATFTGTASQQFLGWALSGGEDANGDGIDDFIIAAPYDSTVANLGGMIYLFPGGM